MLHRNPLNPDKWLTTMSRGNTCRRAVGKLPSLKVQAESRGKYWSLFFQAGIVSQYLAQPHHRLPIQRGVGQRVITR